LQTLGILASFLLIKIAMLNKLLKTISHKCNPKGKEYKTVVEEFTEDEILQQNRKYQDYHHFVYILGGYQFHGQ